jgi:hypothetical protein
MLNTQTPVVSDPNIKQVTLVGGVKKSTTRKRGGQSKNQKKLELPGEITKIGGGGTSPGTMTQLASTRVEPVGNRLEPVGVNSNLTKVGATIQSAGSQPLKVILAAAKQKGKVVLGAAKKDVPYAKTKKYKAARKVRVSMVTLGNKIRIAKTIRQKASKDTIEEIKKSLEKAGLIKLHSKAPEVMLRQMYADFMMLKKRAL